MHYTHFQNPILALRCSKYFLDFKPTYKNYFNFQADWDENVHEIWGAFIDREEAVKRIVERDGKTEDQANARLNNQMTNKELISRCNSVFYSLWDYEITRKQIDKAWKRLQIKMNK